MGTGTELKKTLDALTQQSNQEKISDNFDEIELNELEIEWALRREREEKFYRLKREEYNAKLRADQQIRLYTPGELIEYYSKFWKMDSQNSEIVTDICHYFAADSKFSKDLNKGLMLIGGVGVGKSTLMDFFKKNQVASYRLISCRDIESDFSSQGEKSVQYCSYNVHVATNSDPFGHQEIGFCFDDLGTEANAKHYGKEKNVMAEIILNRYDNRLDYRSTHITTNLTAEELKTQYGSRVTDRMREMFNLIIFPKSANSRRV